MFRLGVRQMGFLAFGLCMAGRVSIAQQAPLSQSQVQSLYFQFGLNTRFNPQVQPEDFSELFPDSDILARDRTLFVRAHSSRPDQVYMTSLQAGFNLGKLDSALHKPRHELKIGVTYYSLGGFYDSYLRITRTPADTLTASQTGSQIFIDSVRQEHIEMAYSTDQIRLDGAYLRRYNPTKRLSFFTGLGFSAGLSLRSKTYVSYVSAQKTEARDANGMFLYQHHSGSQRYYEYETVQPKTNYGFAVYVPLGLDFRLAKRNTLLSKLHVYLETRPGLHVLVVPETGTYKMAQLAACLGLRIAV